jgi:serpin B
MRRLLSIALVYSCFLATGCGSQPSADPKVALPPSDAVPQAAPTKVPPGASPSVTTKSEMPKPQLAPRRLTHVVTKAVELTSYGPETRLVNRVTLAAGTKVGISQQLGGDQAYVTTQHGQSGTLPASILREVWRVEMPNDVATVTAANNQFACDLYGQLRGGDGNLFFSPLSIHAALAMTWAGASGQNEAEMARTLHFSLPQEQVHAAYGRLQKGLAHDEQVSGFSLSVANRLWGKENYRFVPAFLAATREHYGAELASVDFRQRDQAAATINAWVQMQTRDKITELVSPALIDPLTRLILTNAVYFKADWTEPFKIERTKPGEFHLLSGDTLEVPLMHKWESFASATRTVSSSWKCRMVRGNFRCCSCCRMPTTVWRPSRHSSRQKISAAGTRRCAASWWKLQCRGSS